MEALGHTVIVLDRNPAACRDLADKLAEAVPCNAIPCAGPKALQMLLSAPVDAVVVCLREGAWDCELTPDTVATVVCLPEGATDLWTEMARKFGPLAVSALPADLHDLLPKLEAAIERKGLQRALQLAEAQLDQRDLALRASKSFVDRTTEELQAKHNVLQMATARLVEAEQLAAVGRVVTGIAHEISNQLALVGYAEAIKSRVDPSSELFEFADAIVVAQKRLATMVDQMRTFTTPDGESTALEPASLAAIVDEALGILRYDKDVRLRNIERNFESRPLVALRREQFSQVVINLVSNAVAATEPGGEIRIVLSEEENKAVLKIEDQGQGMSPEVMARLGEPFFTTRGDRGSGLGVGICMSIARAHGGGIEYFSELGRGTVAKVSLPLLEEGTYE